jgi:hypothetical protein
MYDEVRAGIVLGGPERPISARTMQRWRQLGKGPCFVRIGNLIRYRECDLEKFIEERAAASTADADCDGEPVVMIASAARGRPRPTAKPNAGAPPVSTAEVDVRPARAPPPRRRRPVSSAAAPQNVPAAE